MKQVGQKVKGVELKLMKNKKNAKQCNHRFDFFVMNNILEKNDIL